MGRIIQVGVGLKMYFGYASTLRWAKAVAALARRHPAVADGSVELFVIPGFVPLAATIAAFQGTGVLVGAQNLAADDVGAFTGEVSGVELAEIGAAVVEVGHAERRSLFGEDDTVVARKTHAALRNGLVPVLCVGENAKGSRADAAAACIHQLSSALSGAPFGRIIVAYEPVWAIGAPEPAAPAHIRAVCAEIRVALENLPGRGNSTVIYGGSAGPGLLLNLGDDVDGLFLGRFAHDPRALCAVLDEAAAAVAGAGAGAAKS